MIFGWNLKKQLLLYVSPIKFDLIIMKFLNQFFFLALLLTIALSGCERTKWCDAYPIEDITYFNLHLNPTPTFTNGIDTITWKVESFRGTFEETEEDEQDQTCYIFMMVNCPSNNIRPFTLGFSSVYGQKSKHFSNYYHIVPDDRISNFTSEWCFGFETNREGNFISKKAPKCSSIADLHDTITVNGVHYNNIIEIKCDTINNPYATYNKVLVHKNLGVILVENELLKEKWWLI